MGIGLRFSRFNTIRSNRTLISSSRLACNICTSSKWSWGPWETNASWLTEVRSLYSINAVHSLNAGKAVSSCSKNEGEVIVGARWTKLGSLGSWRAIASIRTSFLIWPFTKHSSRTVSANSRPESSWLSPVRTFNPWSWTSRTIHSYRALEDPRSNNIRSWSSPRAVIACWARSGWSCKTGGSAVIARRTFFTDTSSIGILESSGRTLNGRVGDRVCGLWASISRLAFTVQNCHWASKCHGVFSIASSIANIASSTLFSCVESDHSFLVTIQACRARGALRS